jgi:hypothetical protein
MKSVMRELAQAKRHYSTLPFFGYLRDDTIAPRDRLAFVPCLAPYLLARADLAQEMVREQPAGDPCQELVNDRARDEQHRLSWYLDDLRKLGFDTTTSVTQSLRVWMRTDAHCIRTLGLRLAQVVHAATPLEKLVLLQVIDATDEVLFEQTARAGAGIFAAGGSELRFFGGARAASRLLVLEAIALAPHERMRCLDLAFRVFDMFAEASTELLALARHALAQRTLPRLVVTSRASQP